MHTKDLSSIGARLRAAFARLCVAVLVAGALPQNARAASTWNPTLLVNTESFQTIDEGDSTTNIEIRFGGTLNEKIVYDRTNNRFNFTRSVKIGGQLTTTGSAIINVGNTTAAPEASVALEVIGTASGTNIYATKTVSGAFLYGTKAITGASIHATGTFAGAGLTDCDTAGSSKLLWDATTKQFSCGTDQSGGGGGASTGSLQTAFDSRYVNVSGDVMTGALQVAHGNGITSSGAVFARTNLTASGNISLNSDNGNVDATLTFGNDGGAETVRFNNTTNNFAFSDDIDVTGNVDATGTVSGDGNFTINEDQTAADAILTFGSDGLNETLQFLNAEDRFQFSDDVHVTGNITGSGTLTVDGNAATKADLTLNSDAGNTDAILTFGNDGGNETLRFNNTTNNFAFSDDIDVTGNVKASGTLTGNTLNVDGNVTIRSLTYSFPREHGASGTVLRTNGNGTLSWGPPGSSSGEVMSLSPEYQDAVYFSSGSALVGTLTYSYDSASTDNFYRWTSTKASLQDYWVSVRVQLPQNFKHFETASGITLRLRTTSTSAANNYVTVRVLDTNGNLVSTGNNAQLTSTTASAWRTNTITGVTNGTYTAGGYITILLKVAAVTGNNTDIGTIKFNWAATP